MPDGSVSDALVLFSTVDDRAEGTIMQATAKLWGECFDGQTNLSSTICLTVKTFAPEFR